MSGTMRMFRTPRASMTLLLAYLVAAFAIDLRSPVGYGNWVLYILGVVLAMRARTKGALFLVAGVAGALTVVGFFFSPKGGMIQAGITGRTFGLILIATTVWVALRWRQSDEEVRRVNRALKTLSECNQAMVRARDEADLLQSICSLLVKEGGYRMAWVGYAQQDEAKSVQPVAWAGTEEGYLEAARMTWGEDERGQGPTGRAIRTGQPAVARNTGSDPDFAPWREEARRHSYASSIALPLMKDGRPFGALMLYSVEVNAFDPEEVRLLTELTHDLAYGIEAFRARQERAEALKALQRANAYTRSLIEASLDPLVTISREGKITDVNTAAEKVTGRERAELISSDFSDYFTEPEKARAGYERVFRQGEVRDYELEIRHRDGHFTPVLYNATVYRDEAGEVIGVFAAARDISERKRAEETLRESEARFRMIAESVKDYAIILLNPDGTVASWNAGAERIKGYRAEEIVGKHFACFYTEEDAKAGKPEQELRLALEQGRSEEEAKRIRKDGSAFWADVLVTALRREDGSLMGYAKITRDITQRKLAEAEIRQLNEGLEQRVRERTAELEAANKELEAFTYSVSHDLRAPLRHVDGFSKLLLEDFAAQFPEEARHYLERIRNGTRQMGQLVDDLLNLSRIGRREPAMQITGLGSLVEEVVAELKAEIRDRKIEWKIAPLPFVECDPALVKQALANLLSNAVKFTRPREAAEIEVGVRRHDGREAIFVRDNGVGFSMKFAEKLFGVFQRLHRAEDFEGTGVGLATVQRIIHKHHGEVWAEAELDRGATFYFTLGKRPEAAAPKEKAA